MCGRGGSVVAAGLGRCRVPGNGGENTSRRDSPNARKSVERVVVVVGEVQAAIHADREIARAGARALSGCVFDRASLAVSVARDRGNHTIRTDLADPGVVDVGEIEVACAVQD